MDKLDTLTLFVRIVERGSFSAAAADLGVSRPVATAAIKALEVSLGARLLHRTTRHVRPTAEGSLYYQRCVSILAALEEANRSAGGSISGTIRVDVAGNLARTLLLPALPQFLARYPDITLQIGESERDVDLVREGSESFMHLPLRPIFRQSHPNFINVRTAYASKIWAQLTKNLLAKSSTKRFREYMK